MRAANFDAPIRDDIRYSVWLKLWGNVCFNPNPRAVLANQEVERTDRLKSEFWPASATNCGSRRYHPGILGAAF